LISKKYECSISPCNPNPTGLSYVDSSNIAYIHFLIQEGEIFTVLNLETGEVLNTLQQTSFNDSIKIASIGKYEDTDRIFFISLTPTSSKIGIYLPKSNGVQYIMVKASFKVYSSIELDGFHYFASQEDSSDGTRIFKLSIDDTKTINTFPTSSAPNIVNHSSFSLSDVTLSRTNQTEAKDSTSKSINYLNMPGLSSESVQSYEFYYNNASNLNIPIIHGTNENINFTHPCAPNSSFVVTVTNSTSLEGDSAPSWLSVNLDSFTMSINAPTISSDEEKSSFGINYAYLGETYSQYITVSVYQ